MKKQRILALLLTFTLLLGVTGMAALADDDGKLTVSLRIEGLEECLFVSESITVADDVKTVAEFIESLDGTEGFPEVTFTDAQHGAYISDIDGLAEMSHGDMSGWLFLVNGEMSPVGMTGCDINDGDDIVIFFNDLYGVGMQFPIVDTSRLLTDGVLKFTSEDTVYDEEWNESVEIRPVVGATVEFDKAELITDENGEIVVPDYNKLAGLHFLQIERFDEESKVPTVLRYAPDYTMFVPFADMADGAWYTQAIEYCVRNSLLSGMGNNTFAPDKPMTMAELVMVLSRIADAELTAEPDQPWFAAPMNWAIEAEVIHDSEYNPNAEVTREIFISMFYKTAALVGDDVTIAKDITGATDFDDISEEFAASVAWAVAAGLVTGVDSSALTINPQGSVSRAVVCQMLMRYYA